MTHELTDGHQAADDPTGIRAAIAAAWHEFRGKMGPAAQALRKSHRSLFEAAFATGAAWEDSNAAERIAQLERRALPDELDDSLREILGRPNFACAPIAGALRARGWTIARKAEAEQAAAIFWMLEHYLQHRADWFTHARDELERWNEEHKATKA